MASNRSDKLRRQAIRADIGLHKRTLIEQFDRFAKGRRIEVVRGRYFQRRLDAIDLGRYADGYEGDAYFLALGSDNVLYQRVSSGRVRGSWKRVLLLDPDMPTFLLKRLLDSLKVAVESPN